MTLTKLADLALKPLQVLPYFLALCLKRINHLLHPRHTVLPWLPTRAHEPTDARECHDR
jgi:hypothetical protein